MMDDSLDLSPRLLWEGEASCERVGGMNLFGWLVLGHFIGDWLLQNDWMAIGKKRHFFALPGLVHYLLYTATILLVLHWVHDPRLPIAILSPFAIKVFTMLVALFIFFSHWLIDGTNLVAAWMGLFGQRPQAMVAIVIDQTLHLVVLGVVALFLTQSCLRSADATNLVCMTKNQMIELVQHFDPEPPSSDYPPAVGR
jgi:hypothetical protein